MKTFADNLERTWTVAITVDAIKRVRALAHVDLLEAAEGKLLDRLASDPVLLCDVLFAVCKPEADQKQISDEDFGRAMAGDAIERATGALLEDLVDFFPQAKRRLLAKALEKLRRLEEAALEAVDRRLDSPQLEKQLEQQLARLGNWSGSWPDSSASIPED